MPEQYGRFGFEDLVKGCRKTFSIQPENDLHRGHALEGLLEGVGCIGYAISSNLSSRCAIERVLLGLSCVGDFVADCLPAIHLKCEYALEVRRMAIDIRGPHLRVRP